jgi:hypothetical protein
MQTVKYVTASVERGRIGPWRVHYGPEIVFAASYNHTLIPVAQRPS